MADGGGESSPASFRNKFIDGLGQDAELVPKPATGANVAFGVRVPRADIMRPPQTSQ